MKEYISVNGITMVEGELIDWEKSPIYYAKVEPYTYSIHLETDKHMCYFAHYFHEKKILTINGVEFYCEDLKQAEGYVISHVIATGQKIAPLHSKNDLNDLFEKTQEARKDYNKDINDFLKNII